MKRALANLIELLPGEMPMTLLDGLRRLRYKRLRDEHNERQAIFARIGSPGEVLQGPFKGMKYLSRAYFGNVLPKILGTYEMELDPWVEKICTGDFDRIVDVGAAEGYYAVGLAYRNRKAKLICFEMYKPARSLIARMAAMNGVSERVEVRGTASPALLGDVLRGAERPAIVIDVEGYEDVLLDPATLPDLKKATALVELHEGYVPGLTERIRSRFEATHEVEIIYSRPRTTADIPPGRTVNESEIGLVTHEGRAGAQWGYLRPRKA